MDLKNLAVVRQTFAQTVFTHKVQEVAAERKVRRSKIYKLVHISLVSAVLVLLAIQAARLDTPIFALIGIGIAVAEIVFMIIQLSFDPERQAASHKSSAMKYMALRDKYILLIADIMDDKVPPHEIKVRRDSLQQEYQHICDLAPQTGGREYTEAQKRLNERGAVESEQFTWSDEEIDRFLPKELRLKK